MTGNPLDEHRVVVNCATLDELDQEFEANSNVSKTDLSVASTVDASNTHPYLVKYADMYAHDNTDAGSVGTAPTFVNVKPPQYTEGQRVLFTGSPDRKGPCEAIIMKIVHDENNQPHYTIKTTEDGRGAADENGDAPKRCVDFKTNPTVLFQYMYRQSKWEDALERLRSNPEEASIWVARYSKSDAGPASGGSVRWQLLPLHLFIALGARSNGNNSGEASTEEGTEDEKNNEMPPMELLDALLSAYPQATQCRDDQSMIPLHSAIRGNSALSIIEKLLDADPSSVYAKDSRGRNAFVLAEKISNCKVRVGSEDREREMRYAKLMDVLSDAARRVSSPTKSPPREEATRSVEGTQEEEALPQALLVQRLQSENLSLRRENAVLRHRAGINERLLQQLVEKLQMYEDQRTVETEFAAKNRRDILLSISEDDDDDAAEEERLVGEKHLIGGDGAYHKRLARYERTTPAKSDEEGGGVAGVVSPDSVVHVAKAGMPPEDDVKIGVDVNLSSGGSTAGSEDSSIKGREIFRTPSNGDAKATASQPPAVVPVLSQEEEDQLVVE